VPGKRTGALLRLFARHAEERRIFQHASRHMLRVVSCHVSRQNAA
jgi:hypothetical protein